MSRRLVTAGTALALASLGLVVDNLRRLRVPELQAAPPREQVAVLLPVRDESAHVEACLEAVLAAADRCPGRVRVLVLDDGSRDDTRARAQAVAAGDSRVRILAGAPLPGGWLGKAWACQQLADDARAGGAEVLVFLDADVRLEPSALAASVRQLRTSGLDVVCPYPRQVAASVPERLVQPLLQWSWMSTLPLGVAERSGRPSLTAANGQLLVADATAYHRAGGHAAVRDQVLEDIALLRAVKRAGGRGGVTDGTRLASCRMYDGWSSLHAGYRKSLWSAFGSPAATGAAVGLLLLAHVVPAVAALRGSRTGAVGYAAAVVARVLVGRRTGARVVPDALAHPVSVVVLCGLAVSSEVGRRRGTLTWRGRPLRPAPAPERSS